MSSLPDGVTPSAAPVAGQAPVSPPPPARQVPAKRTQHGDTVIDQYAWLADKQDPAVIEFLTAENAYTSAALAGQERLRQDIFGEIKARTQGSDLSVPYRMGSWWYYSRTVEGQQYAVHCRREVRPDDAGPPMTEAGQPLDGEQIMLDGNEVAGDSPFFSLGMLNVSPDGRLLAYSTDFSGSERFTTRVKDLATGQLTQDEIPHTYYGSAWSVDGSVLFYLTVDDAWRPYRVWRHTIGTPAADDVLVFEETDERFRVGIGLSRSQRYLMLSSSSTLTSEVWLLDAATPTGEFTVVMPRRQGLEYDVDHQVDPDGTDRLLILHNDQAENFELASAPLADPRAWVTVIPARPDTRLLSVDAFADFLVVYFRRDGLTGLRILRRDGSEHEISFGEPVYQVTPSGNREYTTRDYRLGYTSLATPDSVYDCDMSTGELTLLRRRPVLPLPGGAEFDPAAYEQHRLWATASDGARVPISLICPAHAVRDGRAPLVLYGYGSYEFSVDPTFSIARLSLLDRGFSYAIAHVRGGGELGRHWYDNGKMLSKTNTFTDFAACAEYLVAESWTSPSRLIARGGSAGGLLMGAVANLAPQDFGGIVAQVPFVDPLNTILDPSLPLTVGEWEEWGNPLDDPEVYAYMKAYSPYENVAAGRPYPPILAITSLNDTRVSYHEPAKWVAKLQRVATGGPFLLKTEMDAGHAGRSGRYDAWREEALVLAWVVSTAAEAG